MVDIQKKKKKLEEERVANEAAIARRKAKETESQKGGREFQQTKERAMSRGATREEAVAVASLQTPEARPEQVTVEEKQAEREGIMTKLTEAGAFEEVTPQKVSLEPIGTSDIPIAGAAGSAIASVLFNAAQKGWLGPEDKKRALGASNIPESELEFEPPMTEETLRTQALRKIRDNAVKKGISKAESFGSMIEAIPVVGGLIGRYVGGLVEAPYANAQEVKSNIVGYREEATNIVEKMNKNLYPPLEGLQRARQMEEDIAKLEGRLKLLVNSSAILRANVDELNKIEDEILRTKEMVDILRTGANYAYTAELTGQGRVIPTNEELYYELKGGKS